MWFFSFFLCIYVRTFLSTETSSRLENYLETQFLLKKQIFESAIFATLLCLYGTFFSFFYVFAEYKTHNPNPFGLWSKTWRARIMGTSEYLNSKPKYLRKRIYRCPVGGVKWMNNCRTAEKKLWDSVRKISRNIWLEVRVRDDIRVRPSIFYMLFLQMPRGSSSLKIFELF